MEGPLSAILSCLGDTPQTDLSSPTTADADRLSDIMSPVLTSSLEMESPRAVSYLYAAVLAKQMGWAGSLSLSLSLSC